MSEKTYILPGIADFKFNFTYGMPKLLHKGGAYFIVTPSTTPAEIAEAVKNILRGTTHTPDEAVFEQVAQSALNINWQAMLINIYPIPIAPLLNAAPVTAMQYISPELIDELCEHLKAVYYSLQKLKGLM